MLGQYCKWGDCDCSQITANTALDLINRQKTEIEKLQKKVNLISLKQIEISANIEKKIKTEAYKEFAEALRKHYDNPVWYLGGSNGFFDNLDSLVKEMLEEE